MPKVSLLESRDWAESKNQNELDRPPIFPIFKNIGVCDCFPKGLLLILVIRLMEKEHDKERANGSYPYYL
jgi:hypothetical protein